MENEIEQLKSQHDTGGTSRIELDLEGETAAEYFSGLLPYVSSLHYLLGVLLSVHCWLLIYLRNIMQMQVKDRTETFMQLVHGIIPIETKIEKVCNLKLQIKFVEAQKDLISLMAPT